MFDFGLCGPASSLAWDTLVSTPTGLVAIQCLSEGEIILGYDMQKKCLQPRTIKHVLLRGPAKIFTIETDDCSIQTSADQLFFDVSLNDFISAQNIKKGAVFITKNMDQYTCNRVISQEDLVFCYDLILDEPHLFFSGAAEILTHNFASAFSCAAPAAEWFVGTVIALVYMNQAPEIFSSIDHGIRKLTQKVCNYCDNYYRKKGLSSNPLMSRSSKVRGNTHPLIAGIKSTGKHSSSYSWHTAKF